MLLLESEPIKVELIEEREGRIFMRGEFGRADVPTQNKRIYGRKLWEREIGRLSDSLKRKRVYGELDHPGDGRTLLQRVSHIITDLKVTNDGRVVGEALLLNTPNGKTLQAILKGGGEVGISSRATGSTTQREDGNEEVQDDFLLKSFDFVADPAMRTAYPSMRTESEDVAALLSEGTEPEVDGLVESEIEARVEARVAQLKDELRESVLAETEQSLGSAREAMRRELQESLENDPQVAAARKILVSISELVKPFTEETDTVALRDALEAKDQELAEAHAETEKAAKLAKRAAYRLYVEQRVSGHPFIGTIRSLMGDADKLDSIEEARERLDQILSDLEGIAPPQDDEPVQEDPALREELEGVHVALEELRAEHAALSEERDALLEAQKGMQEKLSRAAEIGTKLGERLKEADRRREDAEKRAELAESEAGKHRVETVKAKRASGFANKHQLGRLLESVDTEDKVDSVVREFGATRVADPMLETMRQRIQKGRPNLSGQVKRELSEGDGGGSLFGHNVRELQELAGIKE